MQFGFRVKRAIVGNDISIKILADGDRRIAIVETELDGFTLARDDRHPPSVHFERDFAQAGGWSPNAEHVLVVTVTDQDGESETATKIFVDGSGL